MNARAVVPDFELPATGNQRFRLSAFRDRPFALHFHPKDHTPGCTWEGVDLRDLYPDFAKSKVDVNLYGRPLRSIAMRDSVKSELLLHHPVTPRCPTTIP